MMTPTQCLVMRVFKHKKTLRRRDAPNRDVIFNQLLDLNYIETHIGEIAMCAARPVPQWKLTPLGRSELEKLP